ncbi:MAG TPA: tetratricopeptide repeat protein [Acidobacteriota bacterium]|nr:tetratricopeptide repeat protein [Acidobacteriota bacterium]
MAVNFFTILRQSLLVGLLAVPLQAQGLPDTQRPEPQQPDVQLLLQKAQQERDRGELEPAISTLKVILQIEEKNKAAREALVDTLMRLARWKEAIEQIQVLRKFFPQDSEVTFLAAAVAFRTGNFQLASSLASESLTQGNQKAEVYKVLALSLFMLKDYDGFRKNLDAAITRNPNDPDAHYHLGRYYYEMKNYREGVGALKTALRLDPEHYRACYFMALCFQGNGDLEESRKNFRKAVEIIERKKIVYGWPFADLGELLVSEGRYEDGIGWLYRGTRNDPGLPYTHLKYAGALLKKENSDEIERELNTAIKLDPNYTEAYYVLGRYYNKINDREKARAAFAKFEELKNNPQPSPFGVRR